MRHYQIAKEKAEYSLHIRHIHVAHHARHRHKCNTRNTGANHTERQDKPRRFILAAEKGGIRLTFATTACDTRDQ